MMLSPLRRTPPLVSLTIMLAACSASPRSNVTQSTPQTAATPSPSAATQPAGATTTEMVDVNGVSRRAIVYVPASRRAGQPAPVILVLHGAGGSGALVTSTSQMNIEADRLSFIAVYPDGAENSARGGTNWNDGRPIWGTSQPPDDVSFMSKLMDLLIAKYMADPGRIFVAGLSDGGFLAARLACELSNRLAAIAVISGPRDDSACALQRPLSVLVIHGAEDADIPYGGGLGLGGVPVPAEADVVAFWRTYDGCAATPATSQVTPTVELQTYTSCKQGTEVRFYTARGAYTWPNRDASHVWSNASSPSKFAATPTIADFLLAHPLQGK